MSKRLRSQSSERIVVVSGPDRLALQAQAGGGTGGGGMHAVMAVATIGSSDGWAEL
jgi:hypothetical protein